MNNSKSIIILVLITSILLVGCQNNTFQEIEVHDEKEIIELIKDFEFAFNNKSLDGVLEVFHTKSPRSGQIIQVFNSEKVIPTITIKKVTLYEINPDKNAIFFIDFELEKDYDPSFFFHGEKSETHVVRLEEENKRWKIKDWDE